MHYADIIAALIKAGHPPRQLADEMDVTPTTISQVIHSKQSSYNVASKISAVTGIPLNKLWPCGRYSKPHARRKAVAA